MRIDQDIQNEFPGDPMMQELHQIRRNLARRWQAGTREELSREQRQSADELMTGYKRVQPEQQPYFQYLKE